MWLDCALVDKNRKYFGQKIRETLKPSTGLTRFWSGHCGLYRRIHTHQPSTPHWQPILKDYLYPLTKRLIWHNLLPQLLSSYQRPQPLPKRPEISEPTNTRLLSFLQPVKVFQTVRVKVQLYFFFKPNFLTLDFCYSYLMTSPGVEDGSTIPSKKFC